MTTRSEARAAALPIWQRIEAAREMLGWSESTLGEQLLGKRTSYTTVKRRNFASSGDTRDLIIEGLAGRGFSKEWLLLGKGLARENSPASTKLLAGTPRDLGMNVLLHQGSDPDVTFAAAASVTAMLAHSPEGRERLEKMDVRAWVEELTRAVRLGNPTSQIAAEKAWRQEVAEIFQSHGMHQATAKRLTNAVVAFHEGGELPLPSAAVDAFLKTFTAIVSGKAKGIREL